MKIITEELSTTLPSMTIEDCEELNLEGGLLRTCWLNTRLFQIKHYRNTVLIVVSYQSIVCIRSIRDHIRSLGLLRHFCLLNNRSYWDKAKIVTR